MVLGCSGMKLPRFPVSCVGKGAWIVSARLLLVLELVAVLSAQVTLKSFPVCATNASTPELLLTVMPSLTAAGGCLLSFNKKEVFKINKFQ